MTERETDELPEWRNWSSRFDTVRPPPIDPQLSRKPLGQRRKLVTDYVRPVSAPPPLYRINGFGGGLYGWLNDSEFGHGYLKLYFITAIWLPIIPLTAYLVTREGEGYSFYGRLSLWNVIRFFRVRAIGFYLSALLNGAGVALAFLAAVAIAIGAVVGLRSLF